MLDFFAMAGTYDQRNVANTKVGSSAVDTSLVTDSSKPYETGIKHPDYRGGDWVIVELYETKEQAQAGHAKWCKVMESPPEYLSDVNECNLEQIAAALGATQCGRYYRQSAHSD